MNGEAGPGARIPTLDILRGVAVMGILAMNVVSFAMPEPAYVNPRVYGGDTGADLIAWVFNFVFIDGKMRGLFSLLFGASLLLVIERAQAAGENPAQIHFRRMVWLFLFGLIHMFLIWRGDILCHYALIGSLAFLFRKLPVTGLIAAALVCIMIETGMLALIAMQHLNASREAAAAGEALVSPFGPMPPAELAADLNLYRSFYLTILSDRIGDWLSLVNSLHSVGPETLGYMLIGMAGLKSGFLTGEWERSRYARWAILCYAISVPAFALLALAIIRSGFEPAMVIAISFAATAPFRPVMILGLAALIILLGKGGGPLVKRIAAAGRAAFTNYVGSSIVMTVIFYGYGLGLYGAVGRAQLYLPVLATWALILLWSKPWLDRYRYGPLEWLWRSLARWSPQPIRQIRV